MVPVSSLLSVSDSELSSKAACSLACWASEVMGSNPSDAERAEPAVVVTLVVVVSTTARQVKPLVVVLGGGAAAAELVVAAPFAEAV